MPEQAKNLLDILKRIEADISHYELSSTGDEEILEILISGKLAKDIVKTITEIVTKKED